ncbi:hypothetical protein Lal_00049996 [Lupinus albus]|nr:hypothetical protein Lal_00049996 [Lupinus albus]
MPRLSTTLIKVKFCRHSHFILLSCIWQLHSEGLSWDEIDFEFLASNDGIKGGVVKTNWTEAPFTALFKNFNANACVWSYAASSCTSNSSSSVGEWITQGLGAIGEEKMKSVHRNYIIYNYCTDMKRFPTGLPPESGIGSSVASVKVTCIQWMGITCPERFFFIVINIMASTTSLSFFLLLLPLFVSLYVVLTSAGNFNQDFEITWGDGRAKILNNNNLLTLSLDKFSGSGFQSKHEYLYGKIDMQLKLVPGNSAGTVTAYYMSSKGSNWDEIDFEFLGNLSGDPYILHTNVFSQGKGNREQQFYLWFDPTADFHTYSILWNPQHILFSVDGTPIREFKNLESIGVPFPKNQAMRIYSSLWNADNWATRGGLIKTDWSKAPFTASYRNFNANACVWSGGKSSCKSNSHSSSSSSAWLRQELDSSGQQRLRWVQKNYMIYNYCIDKKRFPQGLPLECTSS